MKNVVKELANKQAVDAFTMLNYYQPKMPKSLMEKVISENKKEN